MEIVEAENIKVPNSVIVSGLSYTHIDEEVFDFLKQYGSIRRVIEIDNPESEFYKQAIVEFESGEAVQSLETLLPINRPSSEDPTVIHHVKTLASVYSCTAGTGITHTFLSELKDIAKLSGMSFEDILREELTRITKTIGEQTSEKEAVTLQEQTPQETTLTRPERERLVTPPLTAPTQPRPTPGPPFKIFPPTDPKPTTGLTSLNFAGTNATCFGNQPHTEPVAPFTPPVVRDHMNNLPLSPDQLSTPEVQRVVVEHIVKSTEIASQLNSMTKLRPFSGKVPCSQYELDYDTWRTSVEFYLNDPSVSKSHLTRRIVDSLLPPAAHVVKPLGPQASPIDYLNLLDSAYATVEDGDELFAKFLSTHQDSGEKPSSYLHRLHSSLSAVVKKKTVNSNDADKQLIKQFCRGCWNNTLIATLQLEQRQNNPPTFAEFLLLLRTEEDKQAAKANRMKLHLGFTKTKAQVHTQAASVDTTENENTTQDDSIPSTMKQIQKQIADLQAQLAAFTIPKVEKPVKPKTPKTQNTKPKENHPLPQMQNSTQTTNSRRPRPWYCFRCGEDGHIVTSCCNPENPTLVDMKRKELKEKQKAWDEKNTSTNSSHLN
ncbi:uncharacterized protein LOC144031003 [Festucalex cinctus]